MLVPRLLARVDALGGLGELGGDMGAAFVASGNNLHKQICVSTKTRVKSSSQTSHPFTVKNKHPLRIHSPFYFPSIAEETTKIRILRLNKEVRKKKQEGRLEKQRGGHLRAPA